MTVIRSRKPKAILRTDEQQADDLLHHIQAALAITPDPSPLFGFMANIMVDYLISQKNMDDFVIMPDGSAVAVKFKGSRNFYYLPLQ